MPPTGIFDTVRGIHAMALDDRVRTLEGKHADLEKMLEEEASRPLPDTGIVHDLKRQKLAIKDEIADLTHH